MASEMTVGSRETGATAADDAARGDSVFRFAVDLRELRHSRGHPTLQSMSARTGISKSVLSDAFAGKRLPTARTVHALAVALDDDPRVWAARRDALATSPGPATTSPARPPRRPPRRRIRGILLACVATALLASMAAMGGYAHTSPTLPARDSTRLPAEARALPDMLPVNGADPFHTTCGNDAAVVRRTVVGDGSIAVSLLYSARCRAAWALAAPLDDGSQPRTAHDVSMQIYPSGDRFGGQARRSLAVGEVTYTKMLVTPVIDDGVCVSVTLTPPDGEPVSLDPALCADPMSGPDGVTRLDG